MMYIKFKDKYGGTTTTLCKDLQHQEKLIRRYLSRGWKQLVYIPEEIVETYPF